MAPGKASSPQCNLLIKDFLDEKTLAQIELLISGFLRDVANHAPELSEKPIKEQKEFFIQQLRKLYDDDYIKEKYIQSVDSFYKDKHASYIVCNFFQFRMKGEESEEGQICSDKYETLCSYYTNKSEENPSELYQFFNQAEVEINLPNIPDDLRQIIINSEFKMPRYMILINLVPINVENRYQTIVEIIENEENLRLYFNSSEFAQEIEKILDDQNPNTFLTNTQHPTNSIEQAPYWEHW